jgi:alkylhydroperoxidase family enzyme
MVRITPLEPPYGAEVADDLRKLMPPGMEPLRLFRTLGHNPRVLRRFRRGALLDPGAISVREREIIILRTSALCGSEYEWGVHVAFFAAAAGLTAQQIEATVSGRADAFPAHERVLIEVCDALHRTATLDDALWVRVAQDRQPDQLVEIVTLAGQYHMIAYLTNALGIALEPGAPRFPRGTPG